MGRTAHCCFGATQRHFETGKGGRVRGTAVSLPRKGRALGAGQPAAVGASLVEDLATRARAAGRAESGASPKGSLDFDAVASAFGARVHGAGLQAEVARCRKRAARLAA